MKIGPRSMSDCLSLALAVGPAPWRAAPALTQDDEPNLGFGKFHSGPAART